MKYPASGSLSCPPKASWMKIIVGQYKNQIEQVIDVILILLICCSWPLWKGFQKQIEAMTDDIHVSLL